MRRLKNTVIFLLVSLTFFEDYFTVETYEVSCEVQQSDAYKWGTSAALTSAAVILGTAPVLSIRPAAIGQFIGVSTTAILRLLWPLIIGTNDHCARDALQAAWKQAELMANIKLSNYTLEKRKRFFDGLSDTAKKAYEWLPIMKDLALPEEARRSASLEYYDALEFLYFRANDERAVFMEGSSSTAESGPAVQQAAEFFIFIRELAFMQLGVAVELAANPSISPVAKKKLSDDMQQDAMFYWEAGHSAVEKIVRCLPNDRIGPARASLSAHLKPMYDFVGKLAFRTSVFPYSRRLVYKPIASGDYIALRLNDGSYEGFENVFRKEVPKTQPQNADSCPRCGWDLFDPRFSPDAEQDPGSATSQRWRCRDSVFHITNYQNVGIPILTCENIIITYRREHVFSEDLSQVAQFMIVAFDDSAPHPADRREVRCGVPILDRDHIKLIPDPDWSTKVSAIDAIILKA